LHIWIISISPSPTSRAVICGGEAMLCIYERKDLQFLDRFGVQDKGLHAVSHFALRIDDVEAWEATIEREKVDVIYDGEVEWPRSRSWYVTDPTGYEVEVVAWNNDSISFAPMTQAV
jgi:hypothetical protein